MTNLPAYVNTEDLTDDQREVLELFVRLRTPVLTVNSTLAQSELPENRVREALSGLVDIGELRKYERGGDPLHVYSLAHPASQHPVPPDLDVGTYIQHDANLGVGDLQEIIDATDGVTLEALAEDAEDIQLGATHRNPLSVFINGLGVRLVLAGAGLHVIAEFGSPVLGDTVLSSLTTPLAVAVGVAVMMLGLIFVFYSGMVRALNDEFGIEPALTGNWLAQKITSTD